MRAMIAVVVFAICAVIAAYVVGHRAGLKQGAFNAQFDCAGKVNRANGMVSACNAELASLKVQHSETLMELEDAKRDIALLTRH